MTSTPFFLLTDLRNGSIHADAPVQVSGSRAYRFKMSQFFTRFGEAFSTQLDRYDLISDHAKFDS